MRKLRCHAGIAWVLLSFAWGGAGAAPHTGEVNFASQETGITVNAYWTPPPAGRAPAPAVVALHGCGGLSSDRSALDYARNRYVRILHDAGLGVLYVDSFGPRGQTSICEQKPTERTVTEMNRRLDVLAALQWLASQSEVDAKRLVVMGWSHGGQTVLVSADRSAEVVATAAVKPAALVAFYPGCNLVERQFNYKAVAPLLVMSGELDNWTPALPCRRFADRLKGEGQPVEYVQFEGSYHAFDSSAPVTERGNVGGTKSGKAMVGGNPAARSASAEAMLRFLGARLGFTPDMAWLDESVHASLLPASTDFAALTDADSVPTGSAGKTLYREWLDKPFPRAVAISDNGALARAYGRTAMDAAVKNCEKFNHPCRLYAVDDRVVWTDK